MSVYTTIQWFKWWCWLVLTWCAGISEGLEHKHKWPCCRLWSTMQPRCAISVCHVLVLVLCVSSAEDFDWTKNDHGSFYYGTFPAGKHMIVLFCSEIFHGWLVISRAKSELNGCCQCSLYKDFRGVPAVLPIRPKEPGTKMEKDWVSGMCLVIRKAKSYKTKLEIPLARATTNSRWFVQMWYIWGIQGEHRWPKENLKMSLHCLCCTGWCFSDEGAEA